ncbi:MAG TPA: DUF4331 family protein, partial [Thermoanaerobaculia bacterium]|nr:DUF4331 family protein [Thermoanaerobaculia bacterium]
RSYETGREGFVTLVANYVPLQDAYGGPNYFTLDKDALYRIHIDNSGDGVEDLTFQFRVSTLLSDIAIPVGGQTVSIPLVNAGQIGLAQGSAAQNQREFYSLQLIRGAVDSPSRSVQAVREATSGSPLFGKPIDNIGEKSLPDYDSYARSFISNIAIPGCGNGRVFVGQRKESFAVNLGEIFDLVNLSNPLGPEDSQPSKTDDKNITSFILEVPIACLTGGRTEIIGGWTTAALRRNRTLRTDPTFDQPSFERNGDFVQVSRLGMPLVNEVVIGLKDKDRFNASQPKDDAQFATYVTNPTLPELLEILFGGAGVRAPNNFPRQDLLAAFVTGIQGLNKFGFGEMERLNVTIPPTPAASQNRLGVIGGDNAGFPNGRRPGDDVVDIELRVAMGLLCHAFPGAFGCNPADAPSGTLPFTDGTWQHPSQFDATFPYLKTPLAGSPNSPRVFTATLEGRQQVPANASTAGGACTGVLDADGSSFSLSCTHTVSGPTAAHIHQGAEGSNGPVVCDFGGPASPIQFTCPLTPELLSALRQGGLYVNVHSGSFPGGEIRGQLK